MRVLVERDEQLKRQLRADATNHLVEDAAIGLTAHPPVGTIVRRGQTATRWTAARSR